MGSVAFRAEWEARFGRPEPSVVCVGMNYAEHVREQGGERPSAPLLFAKLANTLCWSGETIVLPAGIGHVDAEAELAIVIGTTAHAVETDAAMSYVAGFTCANDVSARDIEFSESQWFRGKGYDTFCPSARASSRLPSWATPGTCGSLSGSTARSSRTRVRAI